MDNPIDYGDDMLIHANNLCIEIKNFISMGQNDSFDDEVLRDYLVIIDEYIRDITSYDFAPRTDRLTKEGILIDLENTKTRINGLLSSGGRRRKSIRRKTSRKFRKGRSRKTYRNGRSRKAYRRSRK